MGRWLSPDPYDGSYDGSNPQSFNRYTYVMNNPLAAVDPSGLICYGDARDLLPTSNCAIQETNTGTGGGTNVGSGGGGDGSPSWVATVNFVLQVQGPTVNVYVSDSGTRFFVDGTEVLPLISGTNSGGGSTGGGGGGGAPSNGPSYSHADVCAASTLLNKGGATFLDALGIIPGEGNILAGVQAGAGLISAGMAVFGKDSTPADFGLSGAGLGLTWVNTLKTIGGSAGKAVPIAGNILSGYSTYRDIKGMNAYYNDCMAGKN
jgi:hypothetical protein